MMLTDDAAPACSRSLRVLAVGLALVFGCEWSQPILALAQANATADSTVVPGKGELPPIQEAETIEVRKPFYKRWWFWTIVAAVVGGAAFAVAESGGGGESTPPSGTVTVTGPAP
jgi:hypothetical protein